MKKLTAKIPVSFQYDGVTLLDINEEGCVVRDEVARVVLERLGDQVTHEDVKVEEESSGPSKDSDTDGPSYADLKARCKELGLKVSGTSPELKARIAEEEAHLAQVEADAEEAAKLEADGKKKATQEDIDNSEELREADTKVGDIIDMPSAE